MANDSAPLVSCCFKAHQPLSFNSATVARDLYILRNTAQHFMKSSSN